MLFSSIHEISAIYPTSRWDKLESLLNPLLKVERMKLSKILGPELLQLINQHYAAICTKEGGVTTYEVDYTKTAIEIDSTEYPMYVLDIIRSCQEVILYFMLANNVRILSASLNRGGGFNRMETGDYDSTDDKYLDSLKKEMWHNAMDSVENLLILLEEDAKDKQVYTELWRKSGYFYQHSDLLFTTALDLSRYLPIDESRERFINLIPTIRNCQDSYIVGRVGHAFIDAIIAQQHPDVTAVPDDSSSGSDTTVPDDSTTVPDDSSSAPEEEEIAPSVPLPIIKHIKQALANYIAASSDYATSRQYKDASIKQTSIAQQEAHSEGDMQIALATQAIVDAADDMKYFIDRSKALQTLYFDATGKVWGVEETVETDECDCCCATTVVDDASGSLASRRYSALADFGGLHLN